MTENRKKFLRDLDKTRHYRIELTDEETKYLFGSSLYNEMPDDLPEIVDQIREAYPAATLAIGNENSRVLYVRMPLCRLPNAGPFYVTMCHLGKKFHAEEANMISTIPQPIIFRFFWD